MDLVCRLELERLRCEGAVLVVLGSGHHGASHLSTGSAGLFEAEVTLVAHPAGGAGGDPVALRADRTPVVDATEISRRHLGRTQRGNRTIEGCDASEDGHRASLVDRVLTDEDLTDGVLVLFLLRSARSGDLDRRSRVRLGLLVDADLLLGLVLERTDRCSAGALSVADLVRGPAFSQSEALDVEGCTARRAGDLEVEGDAGLCDRLRLTLHHQLVRKANPDDMANDGHLAANVVTTPYDDVVLLAAQCDLAHHLVLPLVLHCLLQLG